MAAGVCGIRTRIPRTGRSCFQTKRTTRSRASGCGASACWLLQFMKMRSCLMGDYGRISIASFGHVHPSGTRKEQCSEQKTLAALDRDIVQSRPILPFNPAFRISHRLEKGRENLEMTSAVVGSLGFCLEMLSCDGVARDHEQRHVYFSQREIMPRRAM
jgi:hypothetical protein